MSCLPLAQLDVRTVLTFCRCRKRRCACLFLSARTWRKDLPEAVLEGEPLLQPSSVERLCPLPPPLSAFLSPLL